jgi:hypothetical protein
VHPVWGTAGSIGGLENVKVDIDGSLWQTNNVGLIHTDGTSWETFTKRNSPYLGVGAFEIDSSGNKWMGTAGVLIYRSGGTTVNTEGTVPETANVFPNPFSDKFTIDLGQEYPNITVSVYDIMGRKLFTSAPEAGRRFYVARNGLNPGIYFYIVTSGTHLLISGKVIAD